MTYALYSLFLMIQCSLPNVSGSTTISGIISCTGSVEGSHPEISFVVISKHDWSESVLLGETVTSLMNLTEKTRYAD